ncbi:MAG: hypothetical protein HQ481_16315 [Alphaproteobacteria bacterium]|nr:hypothetical protein [Alphaproteobacteria bacterium]
MISRRPLLIAALWALLGVMLPLASPPLRAEPVDVLGARGEGYDRLLFGWPIDVDYSAERFGNTLVIRFSRPIEGDVAAAAAQLGRYVASGRLGRDGRSAVIELTGNHHLRTVRDGNQIVVDLLPRGSAAGAPTPIAATPTTAAQTAAAPATAPRPVAQPAVRQPVAQTPPASAPTIRVRTGQHPTYDRIVFDWPAPVDFQVQQDGGSARVLFARPAVVDDAAVRRGLPEALRGFRTETTESGLTAIVPLPDGREVRAFQSGAKVVVDVRQGSAPPPTAPSAGRPQPPASQPPASQPPASQPTTTAKAVPPPAPPPARLASNGIPPPRVEPTPAVPAAEVAPPPAAAPAPRVTVAPSPPPTAPAASPPPARPVARRPPTQPVTPALPPVPTNEEGEPTTTLVSTFADAAPARITGQPLLVTALSTAETLSVRFEWTEPVAAVVFPRAGYLWAAFDEAVTLDFSTLAGMDNQIVGQPEQVPVSNGTAVRFPLVQGVNPRVWRDGSVWVVDLQPQTSRPDVPLRVDAQMVSPQGPRLFIPIEGVGQPIIMRDPEVGDGLFLIPVTSLSRGIDGDRRYPELTLLATVQGVAMRPRLDGVEVRILPDGVAFTVENGLMLSGSTPRTSEDRFNARGFDGLPSGLAPGRIFDMSNWRRGDQARFLDERQALQLRISEATSISRSGPRLELAQFYFARGLASEAIGLLRTIEQSDEDLAGRPDVKALRGASSFMLGRYAEAEEFLDDPALNGFSEAELWRGAATAGQGKWDEAVEHFARAGEIPGGYPRNFTTELAMLAAEATIKAGDFRGAGSFLDVIAEGAPTFGEKARLDSLRGRVLYAFGDIEAALDIWRRLAGGEDRWARVRSQQALIEHALKEGEIDVKAAGDALDQLRYAWRGDRLEFDLLHRLGGLRLDENEYEKGLDALRQAVTYFPNNPETREVVKKLTKAFSDLFSSGAVESMTPLQALALYDEFRELTPVGEAGDKIIEGLADRLVRVDLLDRASRLLNRQVKFRLQGTDKARVGARLALIHLLDRQPESAIDALDESVSPGLGQNLARERRRLRARAVFELGDAQSALKLLEGDASRESDLLRADIYWKIADWVEAAKTFRRLVGNSGRDGSRLKPDTAAFITNWAVSLALSDNTDGLNRLRQIYSSQMDATRYREAFRLITNNTDSGPDEFMRLTERFDEIGQFQAFLSSYRDKLKQGPLSATN